MELETIYETTFLLAGEIALATGGSLLAYAIFLDTGSWTRRLVSLIPAGVIGAIWWGTYRLTNFGASGSGVYIDPGASPLEFIRAVVERAPILLFGQWALPSGLHNMLSQDAAHFVWLQPCCCRYSKGDGWRDSSPSA